ncbi:unnamed protein product, partial [Vitis vinifera]|uniref:Uncharacterized protein n=1 Tax=Vitis vinifera TaxID=29760 RepID=D7TSH0_VITVI
MIVKENTCILAYATTLTTDGPTRLVDLRNPNYPDGMGCRHVYWSIAKGTAYYRFDSISLSVLRSSSSDLRPT